MMNNNTAACTRQDLMALSGSYGTWW
jgi:hypothetical protein